MTPSDKAIKDAFRAGYRSGYDDGRDAVVRRILAARDWNKETRIEIMAAAGLAEEVLRGASGLAQRLTKEAVGFEGVLMKTKLEVLPSLWAADKLFGAPGVELTIKRVVNLKRTCIEPSLGMGMGLIRAGIEIDFSSELAFAFNPDANTIYVSRPVSQLELGAVMLWLDDEFMLAFVKRFEQADEAEKLLLRIELQEWQIHTYRLKYAWFKSHRTASNDDVARGISGLVPLER